ncbi:hypothetical protein [Polaribacter sp. L3A8]|uniref:hypothetical protein n=1 Tax=Polaribacter sp. L3A8 TaxID=2686361 RepID=UPI00131D47C5|nr:hypothetical protein [Polaribacter sp. L3A8]
MMRVKNNISEYSENEIIQKRSLREVKRWMFDLNEISQECNNVEFEILKKKNLSDSFFKIVEDNKVLHQLLLEYINVLDNYIECIDLECDLFFYTEHKKNRNLYIEHLNNYKKLKNSMV